MSTCKSFAKKSTRAYVIAMLIGVASLFAHTARVDNAPAIVAYID